MKSISDLFQPKGIIIISVYAVLTLAFIIMQSTFRRRRDKETDDIAKSKLMQIEVLAFAGFAIIFLLLTVGTIVEVLNEGNFLMNISVTIIITWVIVLVSYYGWAIYFYNVNMGWSDEKWNRFREQKAADPTNTQQQPEENPYIDQTFGLPPGTVRGTIALTLLVSGLSLAIASYSLSFCMECKNGLTMDHLEFFKKAFLMMIAFYFGTKSLEILQAKPPSPSSLSPGGGGAPPLTPAPPNQDISAANTNPDDIQKQFQDPSAQG